MRPSQAWLCVFRLHLTYGPSPERQQLEPDYRRVRGGQVHRLYLPGLYLNVFLITVCTSFVCTSLCPLSLSVPAWSVPQCVRYHRLYLLRLYLTVSVIIVCTCMVCTSLCALYPSVPPSVCISLCPLSLSIPAWSVPHCVRYHCLYLKTTTNKTKNQNQNKQKATNYCFDSFLMFAQRIVYPFSVCDKIC